MTTSTAVVARVDFGACVLLRDDGALIGARARGALMGRRKALGNTVVVGDRVGYAPSGGDAAGFEAVVTEVAPRANAFSRRAPVKRAEEQVVAANLDQVVLVASLAEPAFSPGLADRVLCQAEHAGLAARLVLNKADLAASRDDDAADPESILAAYARAGVAGHVLSAKQVGAALDDLREACRGRRSLFVGHSGVGKSTLLNALVPELDLLEGATNARTGKGRHTTSAAVLVRPEPGFELIDTPGVRSFAPWGIGAQDLDGAYREFHPYLGHCRFGDCRHRNEPGCAVRAAVAAGAIAERRHASYLRLLGELQDEEARLH
ncbi:MAG: ribosome small subunit-dependent GTPase A [Candidatus Eisenbacteria bacterium]|uniref:Small ribosomal subunit biogenesis GTPase RsgA n=1 Tax=Eiseniibacteriota bacterium TaxID=2212470 RepID=A0A9D6L4Z7_UNCEI|nr:ribosome small subunit-dependent GTPase A [Candidatus Eisenbacteria bacterium]MBI3539937.1 ribosome small subunit-dependent GTPase A [Candidatus Eisenbacteria bacterium]